MTTSAMDGFDRWMAEQGEPETELVDGAEAVVQYRTTCTIIDREHGATIPPGTPARIVVENSTQVMIGAGTFLGFVAKRSIERVQ